MVLLLLQKAFEKVASLVCSKFPFLENHCKETIRKFLGEITYCIVNVEPAKRICVILRICSPRQVSTEVKQRVIPRVCRSYPQAGATSLKKNRDICLS